MKTEYIVNALDQTGHWVYIKNPVMLNYNLAMKRARELSKLPNIQESEVVNTFGRVIHNFVNDH